MPMASCPGTQNSQETKKKKKYINKKNNIAWALDAKFYVLNFPCNNQKRKKKEQRIYNDKQYSYVL